MVKIDSKAKLNKLTSCKLKKNKSDSDSSENDEDYETETGSEESYETEEDDEEIESNDHTSDSSYHPPKSGRRKVIESDSNSEDDYSMDEDEEAQLKEVRKEIAKIFPSKYMNERVRNTKSKDKNKKNK